jgi:hypothetical protein
MQVAWYRSWFHGETGIVEIGTLLALVAAVCAGVSAVRASSSLPTRWLRYWLLALLAATLYFAGEEMSWGQHLLGWGTPEWFAQWTGNRQEETNLHNINGWFNQKPRHLFQAWIVIGGLLVPASRLWRRRDASPRSDWSYWFWPTAVCAWTAALVLLVRVPEWLAGALEVQPLDGGYFWLTFAPYAEIQEYCMAMFLLVYFCSIAYRARQLHRFGETESVARRKVTTPEAGLI